jgi:hypothetical protein
MQGHVGEHCIEFRDEVERMAIELADPQALHARYRQELVAQIDSEDVSAGGFDLCGEHAIASA